MTESINPQATMSKVTWRLIPFMFLLYMIAYLDRTNAGFAVYQLQPALHASDASWGFAIGFFFWGYFLLEIPSNLIMEKVGARRWMARIMITWGLIAAGTMFVTSLNWFAALRFCLGLAEAGFFPGMILYLTYWYPAAERAKAIGLFMSATALSGVFGSPISGACLMLDKVGGLAGWQWLFLLEGLPSVILGFVVLAYLPDGPRDAKWLSPAEKDWIVARLAPDQEKNAHRHDSFVGALGSPMVWLLCLIYFCNNTGSYGFSLWLPKILKTMFTSLPDAQVAMIAAVPFTAAAIGLVLVGRNSDRTGERKLHVAVPAFWAALMLAAAAYLIGPGKSIFPAGLASVLTLGCLTLATVGMWGLLAPFWTIPAAYLAGTAAAGGIALINSVGNLGGWAGPSTVGKIATVTHSFAWGMFGLAGAYAVLGILVLLLRLPKRSPVSAAAPGVESTV